MAILVSIGCEPRNLSSPIPARGDACLEARSEPPGADRESIHADPQAAGEFPPAVDSLSLRVAVVLDDQGPVLRFELVQTVGEALEGSLSTIVCLRAVRRRIVLGCRPGFVEWDLALIAADIFQQHESRDDVTVASRRCDLDTARFLQRPADAVKRFVGKDVRCGPVAAIEVRDEASTNLE